jgi:hypothetical protein
VKLTPAELRAFGCTWPLDRDVADLIAERRGSIDLDQTIDNLERATQHAQRELEDLDADALRWNGTRADPMARGRHARRRTSCSEAIAQLRAARERALMPGAWLRRVRARVLGR